MRSWTAVIPVKRLDMAKSRLGDTADPRRPELALAFALDVAWACKQAKSVERVIIVTDDQEVIGAMKLIDPAMAICPEPSEGGLNAAVRAGAALATSPVVAVAGDLPALTGAALDAVLTLASEVPRSLLCDAQGSGTAMLCAVDVSQLEPRFGPRSRSAHVADGSTDLGLDLAGPISGLLARARRDVDTPADLWDAVRMGVGTHTAQALRRQQ